MNQEKIGKFIAKKRKEKNLTQIQFAEKLGVSDRSVSNWENGKNMPDMSLFPIISKELNITINDLMSGEIVEKKEYQQKFEENIIYTIDKKVKKENRLLKIILLTLFIIFFVLVMFVSIESIYMKSNINSYPLIQKNYYDDIHVNDNQYFERTIYSYGFYVKYFYKSKNPDKPMMISNNISEKDFEIVKKDFYLINGQLFWSIP
ncbi:helix-turn-helix domain-containing protein [bacterium]|nr:helix-turn-helix domain-containing protein [bacterium]